MVARAAARADTSLIPLLYRLRQLYPNEKKYNGKITHDVRKILQCSVGGKNMGQFGNVTNLIFSETANHVSDEANQKSEHSLKR